jgi:hypothetical protein
MAGFPKKCKSKTSTHEIFWVDDEYYSNRYNIIGT